MNPANILQETTSCRGPDGIDARAAEQLDLFYSGLPKRPYATDGLGSRLLITSRRRAVRRQYIQVNPPWMRMFPVFDIDRPAAALAWEDALLPPPLWTAVNRENGHAHSAWCLESPVLLGAADRPEPMRYLCAVESCMREGMQADASYGGLLTKNPLNPHWMALWGPAIAYDLGALAQYLPDLEKHKPRGRPERAGIGRNVDTFDFLRRYAYRRVRDFYEADDRQGIFVAWMSHLYAKACEFSANEHPTPLDHREAHYIAKSVARYVWRRFTPARFRAIQAAHGAKGGRRTAERAGSAGMAERGRRGGRANRNPARDARILAAWRAGRSQRAIAREEGITHRAVRKALLRHAGDGAGGVH